MTDARLLLTRITKHTPDAIERFDASIREPGVFLDILKDVSQWCDLAKWDVECRDAFLPHEREIVFAYFIFPANPYVSQMARVVRESLRKTTHEAGVSLAKAWLAELDLCEFPRAEEFLLAWFKDDRLTYSALASLASNAKTRATLARSHELVFEIASAQRSSMLAALWCAELLETLGSLGMWDAMIDAAPLDGAALDLLEEDDFHQIRAAVDLETHAMGWWLLWRHGDPVDMAPGAFGMYQMVGTVNLADEFIDHALDSFGRDLPHYLSARLYGYAVCAEDPAWLRRFLVKFPDVADMWETHENLFKMMVNTTGEKYARRIARILMRTPSCLVSSFTAQTATALEYIYHQRKTPLAEQRGPGKHFENKMKFYLWRKGETSIGEEGVRRIVRDFCF